MKAQYIEIDEFGNKLYYSDRDMTIIHREDGPAIEWSDGAKEWCLNGQFHREDGPAVEYANGNRWWYLNGQCISEAEHKRRTAKEIVLTMDQIAAKFGVSIKQLKITK